MSSTISAEFQFRESESIRSVVYTSKPTPASAHNELLFFSLHTLRALVNTSHSPHGRRLATVLQSRADVGETIIQDPYYQLGPASGVRPKMRVLAQVRLVEGRSPTFNLKIKGFGLFGEKATLGCVRSVGLHLSYLNAGSGPTVSTPEQVFHAAEVCGSLGARSKITVLNQVVLAQEVARAAVEA